MTSRKIKRANVARAQIPHTLNANMFATDDATKTEKYKSIAEIMEEYTPLNLFCVRFEMYKKKMLIKKRMIEKIANFKMPIESALEKKKYKIK